MLTRDGGRQDAQHILGLMLENHFLWIRVTTCHLCQLLWHRHQTVQMRTRLMNLVKRWLGTRESRRKKGCCEMRDESNSRGCPWHQGPVNDGMICLKLLDRLSPRSAELSAWRKEADKCPDVQRLTTHPGLRPLNALAFVLTPLRKQNDFVATIRWQAMWD